MKKVFLSLLCLIGGCGKTTSAESFLPPEKEVMEELDVNELKTTDVTYRVFGNQTIKVYKDGKKQDILFTEEWFLMHKDLLKTMNENQDYILKKLSNKDRNDKKCIVYAICLTIIMLFLIHKIKE